MGIVRGMGPTQHPPSHPIQAQVAYQKGMNQKPIQTTSIYLPVKAFLHFLCLAKLPHQKIGGSMGLDTSPK